MSSGLLWLDVVMFAVAAAAVAVAGVRMTRVADRLADITGLGEAVTGAVLLGASTSLAGIIASVTAAARGHPELAISNAVGGIAAQTLFLAFADIAYRRANLEHAAASPTNLINGVVLIAMLSLPLLAQASDPVAILGIHPGTPVLLIAYGFGLHLGPQDARPPDVGTAQDAGDEDGRAR